MTEKSGARDAMFRLKADIRVAVTDLVDRFTQETGLSPANIEIQMEDRTTMSEPGRRYAVGRVFLRFDV